MLFVILYSRAMSSGIKDDLSGSDSALRRNLPIEATLHLSDDEHQVKNKAFTMRRTPETAPTADFSSLSARCCPESTNSVLRSNLDPPEWYSSLLTSSRARVLEGGPEVLEASPNELVKVYAFCCSTRCAVRLGYYSYTRRPWLP